MMKKRLFALLCSAALTAALCAPASAETLLIAPNPTSGSPSAAAPADELPERQGDFYVKVNGEYITFTDAVPKIKNDRSCLPFVAVFDQLGFAEEDMTWNGETSTVTASKDDLTISLTIGRPEITLIRGGETTVIPTDVAPYIEPALSRTYVPFGLVADALGYNVGWDAKLGVVIIDDVDAILAKNTATYELMDKYLAYMAKIQEKHLKITGDFFTEEYETSVVNDSETTVYVYTEGTYEQLTKAGGKAARQELKGTMDMEFYMDGMDVTDLMLAVLELGGLTLPAEVETVTLTDKEANTSYTRTNADALFSAADGTAYDPAAGNIWVYEPLDATLQEKVGLAAFSTVYTYPEQAFLIEKQLPDDALTMAQRLPLMLQSLVITDANYTCTDYLAEINLDSADSAFEQLEPGVYAAGASTPNAEYLLNLYTSGSRITGYAVSASVLNEDGSLLSYLQIREDDQVYEELLTAGASAEQQAQGIIDVGSLTVCSGTLKTTSKEPVTVPPADAVIIDANAQEPAAS